MENIIQTNDLNIKSNSFTGFDVSVPMKTPMDEFLESLSEILVKIKEFLAKPVKKKASADRAKVLESIDLFEDLDTCKSVVQLDCSCIPRFIIFRATSSFYCIPPPTRACV